MGTEKLSDPRLLPASDKVAIIATKPLVPIKIGRGIKKAAPNNQANKSVPMYIIMKLDRNIPRHPSIDLISSQIRKFLGCGVRSPITAAIVSEKVMINIDRIKVMGFSHQNSAKIRNAMGKYTVP
jgi:hypothetical protein